MEPFAAIPPDALPATLQPVPRLRPTRGNSGFPFLCAPCLNALPWVKADEHLMADSAQAGSLDAVWAAFEYQDPVARWIHAFKYQERDEWAAMLGRLLAIGTQAMQSQEATSAQSLPWQTPFDLIAPVPLHPRRLRKRGFNQALLLAHHWRGNLSQVTGNAPQGAMDNTTMATRRGDNRLAPGLLKRLRHTRPQVEMDKAERAVNVSGAFGLGKANGMVGGKASRWLSRRPPKSDQPLAGLRILLVDDVMTTGSTLAACAKVLKQAGASSVEALVLAKA